MYRCRLVICELCKFDGVVRLAKAKYQGDHDVHAACSTHLKKIKSYGIKVLEVYKLPGNANSEDFEV
ncbi:MAG: hypothetical protein GY804_11590 [Alphaproteobacteria bacterium]|nr:hypothetical protein [Alphaproteobacteria bacterium]